MQQEFTPVNFERLYDVEMNVTVRFGRTQMPLRDVVRFGVGSMIELNRTVDEPVELLVNNHPFAHGEVVVIDGYYGVRITDIGTEEERSKQMMSPAQPPPSPQPSQPSPQAQTPQSAPPMQPTQPQQQVQPTPSGQPTQTSQPTQSAQPQQPVQSPQSGQPTQTAQPQSAQPRQAAQPPQSTHPAQPARPDEVKG